MNLLLCDLKVKGSRLWNGVSGEEEGGGRESGDHVMEVEQGWGGVCRAVMVVTICAQRLWVHSKLH